MAKEKCKLIEISNKKYKVPLPNRFKNRHTISTIIKVALEQGEFQYFPRAYTFFKNARLSSDELRAIANELDKLNKDANVSGDEQ